MSHKTKNKNQTKTSKKRTQYALDTIIRKPTQITFIRHQPSYFISIVNTRLIFFANEVTLIHENQAGFRKGYSTIDNIFVLHVLIELYFSFGKKLFCTFIDFRKAFNTVSRPDLWKQLQFSNIKGKCFKVIFNMYQGIKSCVKYKECQSDFSLVLQV